jgi:hypothetical protein
MERSLKLEKRRRTLTLAHGYVQAADHGKVMAATGHGTIWLPIDLIVVIPDKRAARRSGTDAWISERPAVPGLRFAPPGMTGLGIAPQRFPGR